MAATGTLGGAPPTVDRSVRDACADGCLLREMIGGSEVAFAALYDRYSAPIFATAQQASQDRGVAAEVVQETFLALWQPGRSLRSIARLAHRLAVHDRQEPDRRPLPRRTPPIGGGTVLRLR